jgi:micrococcal nuclease
MARSRAVDRGSPALLVLVAALLGSIGWGWYTGGRITARIPATVIQDVDGDTVLARLRSGRVEKVRLLGVDTPETVDPRKPVQCFGREASEHARGLLDQQSVYIETDPSQGDRDIYGRLLAYIWLPGGRNFGEVMIGDGYAHEYTYRIPYAYQDEFRAAQDEAMRNQLGLWSPATCAGDTSQPGANTAAQAPAVPTMSAPPPEGGVQIASVTGARPGGLATVVANTTPGVSCSISYTTPAGTASMAQGLTPKTADSSGVVSWTWSIGRSTQRGSGNVVVNCAGASAQSAIQIG